MRVWCKQKTSEGHYSDQNLMNLNLQCQGLKLYIFDIQMNDSNQAIKQHLYPNISKQTNFTLVQGYTDEPTAKLTLSYLNISFIRNDFPVLYFPFMLIIAKGQFID